MNRTRLFEPGDSAAASGRAPATLRYRRSAYLTICPTEPAPVTLGDVLTGKPKPAAVAASALTGQECALSGPEVQELLRVPSDRWTTAAELGCEDDNRLALWADVGVLLVDDDQARHAQLRAREEAIGRAQWDVHTALFHGMTRWSNVTTRTSDDRELPRERVRDAARRFVGQYGPPPPHFYRVPAALDTVSLPSARRDDSLFSLLAQRRTTRLFRTDACLTTEELASVLFYTFAFHGQHELCEGVTLLRRTSPSSGGLQPTEAYPLVMRVDGLEPGLYHYSGQSHALDLVERMDEPAAQRLAGAFMTGQVCLADAPVVVLLTFRFERAQWKYRAHRRIYIANVMDVAHLSQTLYLVCAELGLGAFVTAAVNAADIDDRLGLDGFSQGAVAVCGFGHALVTSGAFQPDFAPYDPHQT